MAKSSLVAQLFTLRDFCQTLPQFSQSIERVAKIGYQAVQISAVGPIAPKDIAKVVQDNGITVAATHVGWDRFLSEIEAVIEEHKMWDCKHTAVAWLQPQYRGLNGLEQFLQELPPVAERLLSEGIDFSYHNHSHELVRYNDKTWLEMLYNRADPRHLKAEIDTYWIQHGGSDPVMWIRKCANRIPLLHLKDMIITEDNEQHFAEIGEGNLNWQEILKAAQQSAVQWYIVEQDDCYERNPFESLAISYRNLVQMGMY